MSGKYLTSTSRTTCPTRLLTISVDTVEGEHTDDGRTVARSFKRAVIRYVCFRRAGWNCREVFTVGTKKAAWEAIYGHCTGKSTLLVVTPCGIDDLTLLDVWGELDSGRLQLWDTPEASVSKVVQASGKVKKFRGRLYTGNPPDVLYAMSPDGPLKAVGLRNYVPSPIRSLASRLGIVHAPTPFDAPRTLVREWAADQLAETCEGTMCGLLDWWRFGNCGAWRDTTPQLAVSLFKQSYLSHQLLLHADDDARAIERQCLHGPRQSVWFYGDIGSPRRPRKGEQPGPDANSYPQHPGPAYRVDVRSQYPYLMKKHVFPSVLMGTRGPTDPQEVEDLLHLWGIVATVQLQTERAEYPLRTDNQTTFPVGRFTTTLAGPELARAFAERAVRRVYAFARYELKPVFRAYADWLWRRRVEYRAKGNDSGELWAKLMGNSFAGKLAQKPGRWMPKPGVAPRKRWGISYVKRVDTGGFTVERGIAGQREEWDDTATAQAIAPAAFGYLTAYSRLQMRELRELLSPRDVFAQHTDCLWVSECGWEKLVSLDRISPDELGGLRPSEPINYLRFLGPSHRYADGRWTAGGIAEGFHVMKHCQFHVTYTTNPQRGKSIGRKGRIHEHNAVRQLANVRRPHATGPDGWAIPFRHDPFGPDELDDTHGPSCQCATPLHAPASI